ncbi:pyridoxal phosphate-dependent transferase [Xylariales sp. AK1849]|nr:pyridoxal phosphate-dependent transferase [Xylariales sp. AK1849]
MAGILSKQAAEIASQLDIPGRFPPRATYHPDTNDSGLISCAAAQNWLVGKELIDFVKEHVEFPAETFSYHYNTAGGPRLRKALAQHFNEYFNPYRPLDGSEIQVVGAATALHDILGWAVGEPGDVILATKPIYGRLELDFGIKARLRMVYADTDLNDCFEMGVVQKLEEALTTSNADGRRVRALIIVNPSNPLGRCYPRETIVELMKFCQKYQIHFISDEVYGCSVFRSDGFVGFTSALSVDLAGIIDEELCHVTYGMSKDFAVAGLRLGNIVTRSKSIHKAMSSVLRFHNPSGASVTIATAMLEDRKWCRNFLSTAHERLGKAYEHVTAGLDAIGIRYLPANAGFFVYIDLSPYLNVEVQEPDFELAQRLLNAGIALHANEEHGRPGWFRMVYTQDPRTITEGLKRIKKALEL